MKSQNACIHCGREIRILKDTWSDTSSFYHAEYHGEKCPIMSDLKRHSFEAKSTPEGAWYKLPERYQGKEAA